MPKENNKMQVDIDTLKKQNVNDLLSIKELYNRIEELGEKITQVKYIDNTLVKKIKKEYGNLKKIILDENIQMQLDNKIDEFNVKLTNDIETINSQMETKTYYCNTISEMKNKNFKNGDTVITLGYWEINDGGNGVYKVVNNEKGNDNGGTIHALKNGLKAILIHDDNINIKQFGAKNGLEIAYDCSTILQTIIDNTNIKIIKFPMGNYYIGNTIKLNRNIKFTSDCKINQTKPLIATKCNEVFTTLNKSIMVEFSNLEFTNYSTDFSILFSRVIFTQSLIKNVKAFSYQCIYYGQLTQVSLIENCYFESIAYAVFTSVVPSNLGLKATSTGIVDSQIKSCYIKGNTSHRSYTFYKFMIATSKILDNFIDFFASVFYSDSEYNGFDGGEFLRNRIEYSISVLKNYNLANVVFSSNYFKQINNTNSSRFSYLTDSEKNEKWYIFNCERFTKATLSNNKIENCNGYINFNILGKYAKSINNNIDNDIITTFNNTNGWSAESSYTSCVDELNYIFNTTLPSPNWSTVGNSTFPLQKIYYSNKLLTNISKKWIDSQGNEVTK